LPPQGPQRAHFIRLSLPSLTFRCAYLTTTRTPTRAPFADSPIDPFFPPQVSAEKIGRPRAAQRLPCHRARPAPHRPPPSTTRHAPFAASLPLSPLRRSSAQKEPGSYAAAPRSLVIVLFLVPRASSLHAPFHAKLTSPPTRRHTHAPTPQLICLDAQCARALRLRERAQLRTGAALGFAEPNVLLPSSRSHLN